MAKIKAELEEIKRGSADELGSILAKPGQVAGALTLAPAGTILAAGGLVATAPVLGFAAPVTVPVGLVGGTLGAGAVGLKLVENLVKWLGATCK